MSQYDFHVCDVATNVKLWNGHLVNRVRPYPTECDTSIWAPRPKLCGRCGVCAVPWHLQNCPRDRGRERIWNAMKCIYFKILWAPLPTYNKCMIYIYIFKIFQNIHVHSGCVEQHPSRQNIMKYPVMKISALWKKDIKYQPKSASSKL